MMCTYVHSILIITNNYCYKCFLFSCRCLLLRLGNETQLTRPHSHGNTVHIRTQDLLFMGEIACA